MTRMKGSQHKITLNLDSLNLLMDVIGDQQQAADVSGDESSAEIDMSRQNTFDTSATAEGIMLQSSSHALLNCGLLRKAAVNAQEHSQQSRVDVMKERTRILKTVNPVQMAS